jgi:hypothetical protein
VNETPEREARKALARLRRALEKSRKELQAVVGALHRAEGDDFPVDDYREAEEQIHRILELLDDEGRRLEMKILHSGGLEPGRIRRS